MTDILKIEELSEAIEQVVIQGDLRGLNATQRNTYYKTVCKSLGLNPYTKPFDYLLLNGKLVLYANRNCADQLRKRYGISVEIIDRKFHDGMLEVHAKAYDETGRKDEDLGVVPLPEKLQGEVRSNQIMKAVTKAKRRVTLSICGLGWLDETEVETIPGARVVTTEALTPEPNGVDDKTVGEKVAEAIARDPDPPSATRRLSESYANGKPQRTYADRRSPPEDWEKRFGPSEPGEDDE